MRTDGLLLAALAVLLAWPVPLTLARAAWPRRHPRAAIVLWQAIGVSGGLAAVGALVVTALAPLGPHLVPALGNLSAAPGRLGAADLALLALAAALTIRLVGVLLLTAWRVERDLRRQRDAVDLTASHADHRVRVLQHAAPAAYCLPGTRPRIVITEGTIAALADDELAAVLAHEHAHARGRHELVVQPFVAWESALPFLPPARRATAAVRALVEMLADDRAAGTAGRAPLARALVAIGGTGTPGGGLPAPGGRTAEVQAAGTPTLDRVRRLTKSSPPADLPSRLVGAAAWLAAAALVAGPTWLVLR